MVLLQLFYALTKQRASSGQNRQQLVTQVYYNTPPEDENIVGGAGKEVFTFRTLKKGVSTIDFEYSRPWEGGEKAQWTFKLEVHARERS